MELVLGSGSSRFPEAGPGLPSGMLEVQLLKALKRRFLSEAMWAAQGGGGLHGDP